jgi:hypothetical protein
MPPDYACEACERDFGLIVLTPIKHGRVEIFCSSCFGDLLVSGYREEDGTSRDEKVYIPGGFMGNYKALMEDNKVVFYKVLVW